MRHVSRSKPAFGVLVLCVSVLSSSLVAFAKRESKAYPESGKVIGTGLNEHTKSHPAWSDPNGTSHGGGAYSAYSHTYRVETDTRIYELDCGKTAMFHSTGKACGGDKGLQIGDVIHFRIEKDSFFIPLPDGSEQKLRIVSQDLKPDTKPPSSTADVK